MPSVADDLRRTVRLRIGAMSADERLALTGQLAETDLELCCAGQHLDRAQARRLIARRRQAGRLASAVMREERP